MQEKLQWHPGFFAAIQIEFESESYMLTFENEHSLGTKPREIDVLIIKKDSTAKLRKNIGRIFRKYNIIEYKSPDDYLSINDFYRTYAYACFYQADTEQIGSISPDELTLTFVCSHYPYKLMKHLKKVRHIIVSWQEPGIYYLSGDPFPMQLLITTRLSREENLWLSSLRMNLHAQDDDFLRLAQSYEEHSHSNKYKSAMDLIMRANWKTMKEGKQHMCDAIKELFAEEFAQLEQTKKELALRTKENEEQRAEIARLKKLLSQQAAS